MRSESTRFLGQPRLTKAKVGLLMHPLLPAASRGRYLVGDRFNQQQGYGLPAIDHVGTVTHEGEQDDQIPPDPDCLGVSNIVGAPTVHENAEGAKRLRFHIAEDFSRRHLLSPPGETSEWQEGRAGE